MNLRKATYDNTSNAIQLLLNLATVNGLLFVKSLLVAWDAATNVIAFYLIFITGFLALAQGVPYLGPILCIIFSVALALVLGIGILVMNLQIPIYKSISSKHEIHKVAGYMSATSGAISAFGYWDMVVGHYPSFEQIAFSPSLVFHLAVTSAIAWITPRAYTAISKHMRNQFGDAILKFTKKVQDVANDVAVEDFENKAKADKSSGKTLEQRYQDILKAG